MEVVWPNKRPANKKVGAFAKGDSFQSGNDIYILCGPDQEGGFLVVNISTGNIQSMAGTLNVLEVDAKVVVE